ncbi:MAG: ribosome small subunit-dependent GTPase A [Peptococcaceae bacterium]
MIDKKNDSDMESCLQSAVASASQLLEGTIIKGYSGFYYVSCAGVLYECSLRGKNKQKKVKFLPGDKVQFSVIGDGVGAIETLLPRKNQLLRPPVANLDQLVILAAMRDPLPDLRLIDRLTVFAQWNEIAPVICFNKWDLADSAEQKKLAEVYEPAGFPVFFCSTVTGQGIAELKAALQGKFSVLAGNSGVGKSSIMNAISGEWQLATGEVSDKLKRGRHTTRHVELFQADVNTLIADTPGFSSLQLPEDIKREELSRLFPEFLSRLSHCRFATCMHRNEPDCAIKEALAQGEIAPSRYENYLAFLEEVIQQERSY